MQEFKKGMEASKMERQLSKEHPSLVTAPESLRKAAAMQPQPATEVAKAEAIERSGHIDAKPEEHVLAAREGLHVEKSPEEVEKMHATEKHLPHSAEKKAEEERVKAEEPRVPIVEKPFVQRTEGPMITPMKTELSGQAAPLYTQFTGQTTSQVYEPAYVPTAVAATTTVPGAPYTTATTTQVPLVVKMIEEHVVVPKGVKTYSQTKTTTTAQGVPTVVKTTEENVVVPPGTELTLTPSTVPVTTTTHSIVKQVEAELAAKVLPSKTTGTPYKPTESH